MQLWRVLFIFCLNIKMTIAIVVDVETTGLPCRPQSGRQYYPPQMSEMYDSSRIVSIAWIIRDLENNATLTERYYVIKPKGFGIPQQATDIHGISTQQALFEGSYIKRVFNTLLSDLLIYNPSHIAAHNLSFDIHVIKSELYRANRMDIITTLGELHPLCTMRRSKSYMKQTKFPKLADLYKFCFPEKEMPHAHNALHDTRHCAECLQHMYTTYQPDFIAASPTTQSPNRD